MREAIDKLLPLERDLFFALNGSDSPFLDDLMWMWSGRLVWIPLFLFILFLFFYKKSWKEALLVTLFFVVVFALCDQVASSFFKPFFARFRPTHHPDFEELVDTVNGYRGGRYGFISSHAANSFGLATFLALLFRSRWVTVGVFFWALLNSYTRIYLGVHFISDIVAGMLVGAILAWFFFEIYRRVRKKLFPDHPTEKEQGYGKEQAKLLSWFIPGYIVVLIIFSPFLSTLPQ